MQGNNRHQPDFAEQLLQSQASGTKGDEKCAPEPQNPHKKKHFGPPGVLALVVAMARQQQHHTGKTHQACTSHGDPTPVDPTASPQSLFTPILCVMGVQSCPSGGAPLCSPSLGTQGVVADVPSAWAGMDAGSGFLSFPTVCTAGICLAC